MRSVRTLLRRFFTLVLLGVVAVPCLAREINYWDKPAADPQPDKNIYYFIDLSLNALESRCSAQPGFREKMKALYPAWSDWNSRRIAAGLANAMADHAGQSAVEVKSRGTAAAVRSYDEKDTGARAEACKGLIDAMEGSGPPTSDGTQSSP